MNPIQLKIVLDEKPYLCVCPNNELSLIEPTKAFRYMMDEANVFLADIRWTYKTVERQIPINENITMSHLAGISGVRLLVIQQWIDNDFLGKRDRQWVDLLACVVIVRLQTLGAQPDLLRRVCPFLRAFCE